MKKNKETEISVPFDTLFAPFNLSGAELEKKRQDLIEVDAIREYNGRDEVLVLRGAEYVLDELNLFHTKATVSPSDEDVRNYVARSFQYLYAWTRVFSGRIQSVETLEDRTSKSSLKEAYICVLDDHHKIYGHLRTALEISVGAKLSENSEK